MRASKTGYLWRPALLLGWLALAGPALAGNSPQGGPPAPGLKEARSASEGVVKAALPSWLPRYDVDMDLDVAAHTAKVRVRATWTNPHPTTSTSELVFNFHSRYVVPESEVGFMAKMLEILRMKPGEALGEKEPAPQLHSVHLVAKDQGRRIKEEGGSLAPADSSAVLLPLSFDFKGDTKTELVVPLPFSVGPGQSVTVLLDMTIRLPQKQGRWGQYEGVTFLSNWLPVFAYFGEKVERPTAKGANKETGKASKSACGSPCLPVSYTEAKEEGGRPEFLPRPAGPASWQPVPFVPWHQPFFNEAGIYEVRATLPRDQALACSGTVLSEVPCGEGRKEVRISAVGVRDFAFLCSARYKAFEGEVLAQPGVPPVRIHVLAFPEHEFYAREMVRISAQAISFYSRWLGPYPWPDFTIAEAFFGWNGNECATLVMIDERVFAMPHVGCGYVDYLVSHETCHQWWYNLVGTNGYCETWMDEAMATFFAHRLLDQVVGKNNSLMKYPAWLEWAPNIRRDDYRSNGMYGTFGRGENAPVVQEMGKFGHLVNLFNLCYDKGSRIVATIEQRLTGGDPSRDAVFLDFMRGVVRKYQYRILRVEDFRRELEAYTGSSWQPFFDDWLYGPGLSDWAVEKAIVKPLSPDDQVIPRATLQTCLVDRLFGKCHPEPGSKPTTYKVTVWVKQKADCNEPTTLGFELPNCPGYSVRVPILPFTSSYTIDSPRATVVSLNEAAPQAKAQLRVEVILPAKPTQIAIDPDQILVDREPSNNFWKTPIRWRFTPLYTFLEETDLTCASDRWNVLCGPWMYEAAYNDAWYTRSTMLGFRTALYRTQQFWGGAYTAYRTDFRDFLMGIDGMWDHWPYARTQVGYNVERRITGLYRDNENAMRAVAWGRYVFNYGSSLYLPPMEYLEAFATYQDNFLPFPNQPNQLGVRYDRTSTAGLHYRVNYLTPYFDPEGGFQFDVYAQGGVADLPESVALGMLSSQLSAVKYVPDVSRYLPADSWLRQQGRPVFDWLADTRVAMRLYGGTSLPARGQFFTMGGGQLFRGFDLAQRQGSSVWVSSVEWRVPLATRLHADLLDHVMGLRNVYGAVFYDVGDAYVSAHQVGPVAHAVGAGLRLDVTWFSFVERTMLRLDVAKALNSDAATQVWFGIVHPF